jgi:hypothetical protein
MTDGFSFLNMAVSRSFLKIYLGFFREAAGPAGEHARRARRLMPRDDSPDVYLN